MICDLEVPQVLFTVRVKTTSEIIYKNDIKPSGDTFEMTMQAGLMFRSFAVNSRYAAVHKVAESSEMVCEAVANVLEADLELQSLLLISVKAQDLKSRHVKLIKTVRQMQPSVDVLGRIEELPS